MPNNTQTYWSVGSESLHTFAKSIETLGPALKVPKLRGDDLVIPNRPGEVYMTKRIGSNVITLQMWVRGLAEGSAREGQLTKVDFDTNWNNLVRLLWNSGRRFNLTKRFYDRSLDEIIAATARAEFSSGLEPTMRGRLAGRFQVDLKIADGLFFAATPTTFDLIDGNNTIEVPGNADTTKVLVTINGARTNTRLLNRTNDITLRYPNALASSAVASIDVHEMLASEVVGSTETDTTYTVLKSGSPQWMILRPGANVIQLVSDSGTGSVQLQVQGAWT